jgi:uncharacterized membrane protein YagU involved in acid resistance
MVKTLFQGGIAGLAATVCMSALMAGAKAAGMVEPEPPKEITHRAGAKADAPPATPGHATFTPTWLAAHASFGSGCGAAYALLRPLIPGGAVLRGLLYGEAVWATNYVGVLPALGLYPPPSKDTDFRAAIMVAAHAVYGVSLSLVEQRLRGE